MPNRRQPQDKPVLSEEEAKRVEELRKEINGVPEDNPTKCEGLIRELHKKVLAVQENNIKDQLLTELKKVSSRGLGKDLKQMIEKNGLSLEGLDLVLKYLTTKNELAKYMFMNPKEEWMDVIQRRLGSSLEVLGGLKAKEINVEEDWAKKLINKAPSLQSLARISIAELEELCKGANPGEREDVASLVKIATSRTKQISDKNEPEEDAEKTDNKAIDKEKLEKAKALMNEAKEMATQESEAAKKAVNEKMAEITKILELPPDWNKQDIGTKPEQLFEQLGQIIDQFDNVVEVNEPYKSDLEVVKRASGGRALCGIYYSEYVPIITAERPLIVMPAEVTLSSPNNSQQIRYMKFSESRAASNYVEAVKSSSTNVGFSVGGFLELFVGEVKGSYASSNEERSVRSTKEQTSSASVLQYIWIATKAFKFEQEQIKLTRSAREMASSIVKNASDDKAKQEEAARRFMERYGSHFPAGLHTLGGVLFRVVDARSESAIDTSELTEKAAHQLQGQISVGFLGGAFGIGASVTGGHSSSHGSLSAQEKAIDKVSYTYSFQAMGPASTNPASFSKLLANNSTWAIINRGSPHAYIPVWEIIRELGGDFEEPAQILEDTWRKYEKNNREKSLRVSYKITEIIRNGLEELQKQRVQQEPAGEKGYGHWPKNGQQLTFSRFRTLDLSREEAYQTAVEIVMVDPRYRICEIALCAGDVYTVRCWKASEKAEMTFERGEGEHVLFYSHIIFKWNDKIPA